MTTPRDPDRLIRSFLLEGDEQLHDRVYDAVRADIDHRRQRVVFGPWRTSDIMNKLVPLGLGAAAVVVALVVGARFLGLPDPGSVGGGTSTAEPSPTASTAPATPSPTPAGEGGVGTPFVLTTGERSIDGMPAQRVDVILPASGWRGQSGGGIVTHNGDPNPPDGAGMIVFFGDLYVYGDPCRWTTTRPDTPATTVDEIVAALAAQSSREASGPVDITVDGHAGKAITLHVPDDADFGACDGATFGSWGLAGADQMPMRYHQGSGQIDEVWVLDVDGTPAILDWSYYEGTPQTIVDELRSIVESATFG